MSAEQPALPRLPQRIAQQVRALAAVAVSDGSTISLVIANLLAIAIAYWYGMSLRELMFVFWLQSVIIGVSQTVRILCLKDFSKAGFKGRYGAPLDKTGPGKINFALQFVIVYGFPHVILLLFITFVTTPYPAESRVPPLRELLLCGLTFAVHQVYSTARKIKLDRQGVPHVHTMMGAPLVRILPMHATILVGGLSFSETSAVPWWLFVGLKTVADVAMHVREERSIQEALFRSASPPEETVKWYRERAEKGNAEAQLNLGKMYLQGRGVPQSNSEALKWLRRAADQNDLVAKTLIMQGGRSGRW